MLDLLSKGGTPQSYEEELKGYAVRRLWFASAWLLGASHRQIAALHGISHSSVLQAVNKIMTSDDRRSKRLRYSMKPTELAWYREQFQKNVSELRDKEPLAVSAWLITNTPFPGD